MACRCIVHVYSHYPKSLYKNRVPTKINTLYCNRIIIRYIVKGVVSVRFLHKQFFFISENNGAATQLRKLGTNKLEITLLPVIKSTLISDYLRALIFIALRKLFVTVGRRFKVFIDR